MAIKRANIHSMRFNVIFFFLLCVYCTSISIIYFRRTSPTDCEERAKKNTTEKAHVLVRCHCRVFQPFSHSLSRSRSLPLSVTHSLSLFRTHINAFFLPPIILLGISTMPACIIISILATCIEWQWENEQRRVRGQMSDKTVTV